MTLVETPKKNQVSKKDGASETFAILSFVVYNLFN